MLKLSEETEKAIERHLAECGFESADDLIQYALDLMDRTPADLEPWIEAELLKAAEDEEVEVTAEMLERRQEELFERLRGQQL